MLICLIIILNRQNIKKPKRTLMEFQASCTFVWLRKREDTTENNGSNRLKTRDDISQILRQFIWLSISRVRAFLKIFVDLSYDERPARR